MLRNPAAACEYLSFSGPLEPMSTVVKRSVGRPRKHPRVSTSPPAPVQSPESPEVSAHNSPEVTIVESPSSRKLLKPRIARDATTRRVKRNMDLRDKNNRIKFRSSLLSKKDRAWREESWETDDDEGAESTEKEAESKENEPTEVEKIRG